MGFDKGSACSLVDHHGFWKRSKGALASTRHLLAPEALRLYRRRLSLPSNLLSWWC